MCVCVMLCIVLSKMLLVQKIIKSCVWTQQPITQFSCLVNTLNVSADTPLCIITGKLVRV